MKVAFTPVNVYVTRMSEDISDLLGEVPKRRKPRAAATRTRLGDMPDTALRRLIEQRYHTVGKAAEAWGVTRQSLYLWLKAGHVTPQRALEIERMTPGADRFALMSPEAAAIWQAPRRRRV